MPKSPKDKIEDRVGIYLDRQTRYRLSMLKAALTFERGRFTQYDQAVNILLDHYDATIDGGSGAPESESPVPATT